MCTSNGVRRKSLNVGAWIELDSEACVRLRYFQNRNRSTQKTWRTQRSAGEKIGQKYGFPLRPSASPASSALRV